ncbi:T3JAM protein, partial [Bucco capensis]|nr:T3JAM protein [Bucco capensis]
MLSQPEQAGPRRARESYEEKCERRQELRESLRARRNLSSCRCPSRGQQRPPQSPRQSEFLRRRNLPQEAGRTLPAQHPKAGTRPAPSAPILLQVMPAPRAQHSIPRQASPSAPILLQHPWSCPTFPPAHSLLSLSIPLDISAGANPKQGASVATQGTQTLKDPRAGVRDSSQQTDCGTAVFNKEMVQLSNYLKEALHRELLLKQKMVILQELFSTLLQASEKSWQGQLNEDKLKCKLRALENQLQACTQSYSKEYVKKILIEMEDQKQTYEQKAKAALQKMLEDKLQTEQQLQNSQRSLAATKEELAFWQEHYSTLKAELTKMSTAHTELENSFHSLQSQLQQVTAEKEQLGQSLSSLQNKHAELQQQARALQEDNQLKAAHISATQAKLQQEESEKEMLEATISHLHSLIQKQTKEGKSQEVMVQTKAQALTMQSQPLTAAKGKLNTLLEHPEEEQDEEEGEESLKNEIQERTSQLAAKENECWELRWELEALGQEYCSCLSSLHQCREELEQAKRQSSHWIPLLVAGIAMAIATFLASYRP